MALSLSIEWGRYKHLVITDIHEKFRENVMIYAKEAMCHHKLYRVLGFRRDKETQRQIGNFITQMLENDCSLVVMDPESKEIYAVALVKWMTEAWRSWTGLRLMVNHKRLLELLDMTYSCLEESAEEHEEKLDSLHLFYFHAEDFLKNDTCFMWRFFNCICEVARHMGMPRVTFMALSQVERNVMDAENFSELFRVIYSMYIYKGRRPFDHLRDIDELYAALFERRVKPVKPYGDLIIRHLVDIKSKDDRRKTKIAELLQPGGIMMVDDD